jgi:hypothetical protein
MFTSILLLIIPFLTIAFLRMAIKTCFSSNELVEMGVCLEDPEPPAPGCPFQRSENIFPSVTVICCNT